MKKQHENQLLEFVVKHYVFGNAFALEFDFVKDYVLEFAKPTDKKQQALLDKIQNYEPFMAFQEKLINEHKLDPLETEEQINDAALELINDVIMLLVNSDIIKLNI